jgi:hypothetical protein
MEPSPTRVAYRYLKGTDDLVNISRRKVADLVNKAIKNARVGGFHRDKYWKPINAIWDQFNRMGIPFSITKSEYQTERGVPVSKTWKFEIPFTNERGRPQIVYGQVVASGAGSVDDPLETYDVTAYAN